MCIHMYYTVLSTTSAAFYFCCVEFSILFTVGIVLLKLSITENSVVRRSKLWEQRLIFES